MNESEFSKTVLHPGQLKDLKKIRGFENATEDDFIIVHRIVLTEPGKTASSNPPEMPGEG